MCYEKRDPKIARACWERDQRGKKMAEYIEREALRSKAAYMHGFGKNKYVPLRAIEDAPAADVAPVVHGRWEHLEQDWFDLWRCSACGDEWTFEYDPTSADTKVNYCPNCGADMRGSNDE